MENIPQPETTLKQGDDARTQKMVRMMTFGVGAVGMGIGALIAMNKGKNAGGIILFALVGFGAGAATGYFIGKKIRS